jgi:hypothetical protein
MAYQPHAHRQRIEAAFQRASQINDLETRADAARYLCILMSGYLERAVRHFYGDFANRRGHPALGRYVERRLDAFQNAKPGKLIELAGDFDAQWAADLTSFMDGRIYDHLDSVVANKNLIAHGESVGVTYTRAREMFESVKRALDFIEAQCA